MVTTVCLSFLFWPLLEIQKTWGIKILCVSGVMVDAQGESVFTWVCMCLCKWSFPSRSGWDALSKSGFFVVV